MHLPGDPSEHDDIVDDDPHANDPAEADDKLDGDESSGKSDTQDVEDDFDPEFDPEWLRERELINAVSVKLGKQGLTSSEMRELLD